MVRFYTPNFDEACDALDLYDIDYDLDDGDRIISHYKILGVWPCCCMRRTCSGSDSVFT